MEKISYPVFEIIKISMIWSLLKNLLIMKSDTVNLHINWHQVPYLWLLYKGADMSLAWPWKETSYKVRELKH